MLAREVVRRRDSPTEAEASEAALEKIIRAIEVSHDIHIYS